MVEIACNIENIVDKMGEGSKDKEMDGLTAKKSYKSKSKKLSKKKKCKKKLKKSMKKQLMIKNLGNSKS